MAVNAFFTAKLVQRLSERPEGVCLNCFVHKIIIVQKFFRICVRSKYPELLIRDRFNGLIISSVVCVGNRRFFLVYSTFVRFKKPCKKRINRVTKPGGFFRNENLPTAYSSSICPEEPSETESFL